MNKKTSIVDCAAKHPRPCCDCDKKAKKFLEYIMGILDEAEFEAGTDKDIKAELEEMGIDVEESQRKFLGNILRLKAHAE